MCGCAAVCNDWDQRLCIAFLNLVFMQKQPPPSGSHKRGETMPSLVLQTHPVKSAASLTTNPQSCFSHAHLASSICVTVSSIRVLPGSTDQLVFPAQRENPTGTSLFSPQPIPRSRIKEFPKEYNLCVNTNTVLQKCLHLYSYRFQYHNKHAFYVPIVTCFNLPICSCFFLLHLRQSCLH